MQITEEMIPKIEEAIGVKLYDQQKEYLLNNKFMWGGRATGKTTAFCIKLALSDGEPLDIRFPERFCDYDFSISNKHRYARSFFKHEFLQIRERLMVNGFEVRDITRGNVQLDDPMYVIYAQTVKYAIELENMLIQHGIFDSETLRDIRKSFIKPSTNMAKQWLGDDR